MSYKRGVIYVGWNNKYIVEAKKSAETVRKFCKLPTCLLVDNGTSEDHLEIFDVVLKTDFKLDWHHRKAEIYPFVPFEETLFLDTDTVVLNSLDDGFARLKRYDMCMCLDSYYNLFEYYPKLQSDFSLPIDTPMYNSGVIFFKKNSKVEQIFKEWQISCEKYGKTIKGDQGILSAIVAAKDVHLCSLPINYNFRGYWQFLRGPIIIWHARLSPPLNAYACVYSKYTPSWYYDQRTHLMEGIDQLVIENGQRTFWYYDPKTNSMEKINQPFDRRKVKYL